MHTTFPPEDALAKIEPKEDPVTDETYDYCSKRSYWTKPNNFIESVIHSLMCGLGGGLVSLHAAYMECGLFSSIVLNVVLSAIVGYCVCMLVWSAQKLYGRVKMPELTYPDVMEYAVLKSPWPCFRRQAKIFRYLVEITLMFHLYGTCCVFLIMIARNMKELASGDGTITDGGDPPLKAVILTLIIPCAIICMITDLKRLAPFALICDVFAVSLVLVLLWYSLHDIRVSPLDRHAYKSLTGLVEFTCICIFVLEPVCYAFPIENNMKRPEKFHLVVLTAMPIYTMAMMTVGFFGYWYYGENSIAPITIHFPFSPFAVILKVFLCIILYVIYALCFYLAFDIEWHYLKRFYKLSNHWFWERLYRAIHVVALTFIAYSLPNVTRLMGILGASSTVPAVLIYPPFIEVLVNWVSPGLGRHNWRLFKSLLMILLGLVICGAGSYCNVVGMIKELSPNLMLQPHSMLLDSNVFWTLNGTNFKYDILTVNLAHAVPNKTVSTRTNVTADFRKTTHTYINSRLFPMGVSRNHRTTYTTQRTQTKQTARNTSRLKIPFLT